MLNTKIQKNKQKQIQNNKLQKMASSVPHNKLTLKPQQKQRILFGLLDKQLQKQTYLNNMYQQEIQTLTKRKSMFENGLRQREMFVSNASGFQDFWRARDDRNGTKAGGWGLSDSHLDQSYYIPNQQISRTKKKPNDSPIKKLANSMKQIELSQNASLSPSRYNRIEQLHQQLHLIQSRLKNQQSQPQISSANSIKNSSFRIDNKDKERERNKEKDKEDDICVNLQEKIKVQEDMALKELEREQQLQIKRRYCQLIRGKISKIKQQIFKNTKVLNVIERDRLNRNKEIIMNGYTTKMKQLIEFYGGQRKC